MLDLSGMTRDEIQDAVPNALIQAFKEKGRASFVAATGFGKSKIIVETLRRLRGGNHAVFMAPNRKVLRDTLVYLHELDMTTTHSVAVLCSQSLKGKKTNHIDFREFSEQNSREAQVEAISSFFKQKRAIVLAMYQSQEKLIEALADRELDLIVFDEAHRVAGSKTKQWSRVLDDDAIRAKYRAFFTATPKNIKLSVKAAEKHVAGVYSFDDESVFGPIVGAVSTKAAIEMGAINPYQVKVLVDVEGLIPADERRLPKSAAEDARYGDRKPSDYEVAMVVGALREAWKAGGRKVLAYTNQVDDAEFFAKLITDKRVLAILRRVEPKFPALSYYDEDSSAKANVFFLHGGLRGEVQDAQYEAFTAYRGLSVIVSCKTIVEGVNLPAADVSLLLAKRDSPIDITQIIGRVLRLSQGKKWSQVILPMILDSLAQFEVGDQFRKLRNRLEALQEHDESWKVELSALPSTDFGRSWKSGRADISPRLSILLPSDEARAERIARTVTVDTWSSSSEAKKRQLLELTGARPVYGTPLGIALSSYTRKTSDTYDLEFDAKIRETKPHWFVDTAAVNKTKLLACTGSRPSQHTPLGLALRNYTTKSQNGYDPTFDAAIRKAKPAWFVERNFSETNKKKLLACAGERPFHKTPLGKALSRYTNKSFGSYDPGFDAAIRKAKPEWFIDTAAIKKKELLAYTGERPSRSTLLGPALCKYTNKSQRGYDPVFDEEIRKAKPHWFVVPENKKKTSLLACVGERPYWKTLLGHALQRYTTKSNKSYDPVFDKEIRKAKPHWFTKPGKASGKAGRGKGAERK